MSSLQGSGVCDKSTSPDEFRKSASRLFEDFAFKNAVPIEVAKNKCQIEKLKVISGDGRLRDAWTQMLVQVWLMQKKATLMLNECKNKFYSKVELKEAKELGLKQAYLNKAKKEIEIYPERAKDISAANDKYMNICFDSKAVAAMSNVQAIAISALPGVSSAELLKIVDSKQNLILNKKTGKPLTNSDILNNDLSDLGFLDFKNGAALFKKVDKYNQDLSKEKEELNRKLTHTNPLSDDLKEMLYSSGSVNEVLLKNNLDTDPAGHPNPGAACLSARYEPNLVADTVEFVGTSMVGGVLIKAALSSTKYVKIYKAAKAIHENSFLSAQAITATSRLMSKCFKTDVTMKKIKEKRYAETQLLVQGRKGLSKVTDFEKWKLDFKPEETPTCESEEIGDSIARENEQRSCLLNEASYGLPFKTAIATGVVNAALDSKSEK